jgi:hypothetical protein
MADEPRSHDQVTRVLACILFGLATAELVAAVSCAVAGGISFAHAVAAWW